MKQHLRNRIGVTVALIALVIATITSIFSYQIIYSQTLNNAKKNLSQLSLTVQRTASIAVFLENKEIADEVISGLAKNDSVAAVSLTSNTGFKATTGKFPPGKTHVDAVTLQLESPFSPGEKAGELTIIPNTAIIGQQARTNALIGIAVLAGFILLNAFIIARVVQAMFVAPIGQIMSSLNAVVPGDDVAIAIPDRHKEDEIGRLTEYINSLLGAVKKMLATERESEERLRLALISSKQGWFDLDFQTGTVTISPEYAQMIGYAPAELSNLEGWMASIHPEDRDDTLKVFDECVQSGDTKAMEYRRRTKSGEWLWIRSTGRVTEYDDGHKPLRMTGVHADITERKQAEAEMRALERQLQQTQRLESLGVLAGGIAHDFNNILAIILGYCGLTKMDHKTTESNIAEIEKAVERAAELCRQMLAYAGKAPFEKTEVNITTVADEMIKMLRATIPQNVVIKPEFSDDLPHVLGDASQIRQIVMNLVINASEAIAEAQGEIRVCLAITEIKARQAARNYLGDAITPGWYVCLEVSDNGGGMSEETYNRIFEPFYTTKFYGRGLGMSAIMGIIQAHNGALQLFSEHGKGTTFKVYLPFQPNGATEKAPRQFSLAPWKGSGTILLVEDEEQILMIAKALMEALGFKVVEAVNGREALEMYRKNAGEITMVVTDIGMPVMDGYALFNELKKLDPALPVIISSGFGETVISSRIASDQIAGLISKPYGFEQLRTVLKDVTEKFLA
jgi:PAS domain S-box-containing protein